MLWPAWSSESTLACCSSRLATRLQAVDGQGGEVAGVPREREAGVVQAAGPPGEQETAVRRLADAERHQDVPVAADRLTLS